MDITPQLIDWLNKMGYDGDITDSVKHFVNRPDVANVFMQLIKNVRPKQEIEAMRKKLILSRISKKLPDPGHSRRKVNSLQTPIPEIDVYYKKRELEETLNKLSLKLLESEANLQQMKTQNRVKYLVQEGIKKEIKSCERFVYLLKVKAEQIKKQLDKVEDMNNFVKNLTPEEGIDPSKTENVKETLKQCSKKLEKIVENQKFAANSNSILSTAKKPYNNHTFSLHFSVFNKSPNESLGLLYNTEHSFMGEMSEYNISNAATAFDDEEVKQQLKPVLYNNSRRFLWNTLVSDLEKNASELLYSLVKYHAAKNAIMEKDPGLFANLYAMHIKSVLLAKKHSQNIEKLQTEIQHERNRILSSVSPDEEEITRAILNLLQKDAGYSSAIEMLKKEMETLSALTNKQDNPKLIREQKRNAEEQIATVSNSISQKMNLFKSYYEDIIRMREKTQSLVWKLRDVSRDQGWTLPLRENVHEREIQNFMNFPLDYNRCYRKRDEVVYYRDISTDLMIPTNNVDPEVPLMLADLIDYPFNFPEIQLKMIRDAKSKLQMLKQLKSKTTNVTLTNCTVDDYKNQELYLSEMLGKISLLVEKIENSRVGRYENVIRELVSIWRDTPFGNYISCERLYNDKNFQYYAKLFDTYYNKLQ